MSDDSTRRTAGVPVGAYSDFRPGQRVMTIDGYPGRVVSVAEGPASSTIVVVLDNGMGGGEYDDSMLSPLNEKSSAVDRTADVDYPELGTILTDRPDHEPSIRTGALAKEADYFLDTPESLALSERASTLLGRSNEAMRRVVSDSDVVPEHTGDWHLYLPPGQDTAPQGRSEGYTDGMEHAKAGGAREPKKPGDPAYMDDYSMGWAHGVPGMPKPEIPLTDPSALHDDTADPDRVDHPHTGVSHRTAGSYWGEDPSDDYSLPYPDSDPVKAWTCQYCGTRNPEWASECNGCNRCSCCGKVLPEGRTPEETFALREPHRETHRYEASKTAGLWDFLTGSPEPSRTWEGPGHNYSYDWCRFRKNSRCMYPRELNKAASDFAGYAVWIPEDRGYCPRVKWEDQQACPVGEPGPHVPGGFTDATVSWEEGGQRGAHPQQGYRPTTAAKAEDLSADTFAFHFTAAWSDVRRKAKRIRSDGGVRVLSSLSGEMVAQVQGDNHVYQTRVSTVPGRYAVGSWECGCAWAAYSWGRTGPWKKYEGRMCSHALACVYEAQSRGMFGKTITEDQVAPAWLPKGTDVKVPGDWDRDKGGYTAALESDPWVRVALLVATGRPIAEIHPIVMAMAFEGNLAVASAGPLVGQVGGQVRSLFFEDGEVVDVDTGTPIPGPILYPTYHPSAGLDFRTAAKEASMGAEHWAMTFDLPGAVLVVTGATDAEFAAAARAMMTLSEQAEPAVTSMLMGLSRRHSGHLEMLDKRLKKEASLLRKMKAEAGEFGGDATKTATNMSDTLRYTMVANPDNYVRTVKDCLADLQAAGYGLRVKNYWERDDPYQGVNVAVLTPAGHPFELQFHTPESMRIKSQNHKWYERFRSSDLDRERLSLYKKMSERANKIAVPGGVELIQTLKRQPYRPLVAAALGSYRYLQLHTLVSATPTTVMREYLGPDDYRIEVWRNGHWVMDNEYARHVHLGEVRTDEISEEQAQAAIAAMGGHHGLLAEAFVLSIDSDLHDEPEPALPTTDGADEDAEADAKMALARAVLTAALAPGSRRPSETPTPAPPPARSERDPHAWLLAGSAKDTDVAAMAQQFIASRRHALKDFSAAERRQIIDEGEGEVAGNFAGLDLTGTHYKALDEAQARKDMDNTLGW